ncbi:MAG: hydrolase TatD [Flavobacteriales bacterium]|nr:hydrolase TatD [Flavobacteriales bacterium]|tara:strand:- start:70 stop:840 length:771 start_codon:yes stop_codon:yes gene_type:complete
MLTDSHTHLYLKEFDNDLHTVIKNAQDHKVSRFLLPNINTKTLPKLLSVCQKYKNTCFPMIGLHPCSVTENYVAELKKLYSQINQENFIAIGEVGIDLYWEKKYISEQKAAFTTQLNWANDHQLPIIIHSRNSFDEIYSIIKREKRKHTAGIFHCFSGTYDEAKKIIDMGFFLGIGGILTFKNTKIADVIEKIGLQHLVLETDSPYLAPHPMRGKRNEPKFLSLIADKLSKIKNVSMEEIYQTTNTNIQTIFSKLK